MKITISTSKQSLLSAKAIEDKSKKIFRLPDFLISLSLLALFFGIPLFFTNITLQGIGFDKVLYFYFWLMIGIIAWAAKGAGEVLSMYQAQKKNFVE